MAKAIRHSNPLANEAETEDIQWLTADRDYSISLSDGKLVCRNPKGKRLATLPLWLKESDAAQQLFAMSDWLDDHALECLHTVERWLLRSLLVPREIFHQVWCDVDWRKALEM